MPSSTRNKLFSALLALNALLVVLVLVLLLSRHEMLPSAFAQTLSSLPASSADLEVVPAQMSTNTYGCYIVDRKNATICAYQYLPGERTLRLQAARSFAQDLNLANFNTAPSPEEVRDLVDKEKKAQPAK